MQRQIQPAAPTTVVEEQAPEWEERMRQFLVFEEPALSVPSPPELPINVYTTIPLPNVDFLAQEQPLSEEAYLFEYDPRSQYFVNKSTRTLMKRIDFLRKYFPTAFKREETCTRVTPQQVTLHLGRQAQLQNPNYYSVIIRHPDGRFLEIEAHPDVTRTDVMHTIQDKFGIEPTDFQIVVYHPRMYDWTNAVPLGYAAQEPLVGNNTLHQIIGENFIELGTVPNEYSIPIELEPAKMTQLRLAKTDIIVTPEDIENAIYQLKKNPLYAQKSPEKLRALAKTIVYDAEREKKLKKLKELFITAGRTEEDYAEWEKQAERRQQKMAEARTKKRKFQSLVPGFEQKQTEANALLAQVVSTLCDIMLQEQTVPPEEELGLIDWLVNAINRGYDLEGIDYAKAFREIIREMLAETAKTEQTTGGRLDCILELLRITDEANQAWQYAFKVRDMVPQLDTDTGEIIGYVPGKVKPEYIQPTPMDIRMTELAQASIPYASARCTECGKYRVVKPGEEPPGFLITLKDQEQEIVCEEFGINFEYDNGYQQRVPIDMDFIYASEAPEYISGYDLKKWASFAIYRPEPLQPAVISAFVDITPTADPDIYDVSFPDIPVYEFIRDDFIWARINGVQTNGQVYVQDKTSKQDQLVPNGKALNYYCVDAQGNETSIPLTAMASYKAELWRCGDPTMDLPPLMREIQRQIESHKKLLTSNILSNEQEQELKQHIQNLYKKLHLSGEETAQEIEERLSRGQPYTRVDKDWLEQQKAFSKDAQKRWNRVKQFFKGEEEEEEEEEKEKRGPPTRQELLQQQREQTLLEEIKAGIAKDPEDEIEIRQYKRRKLSPVIETDELRQLDDQMDFFRDQMIYVEDEIARLDEERGEIVSHSNLEAERFYQQGQEHLIPEIFEENKVKIAEIDAELEKLATLFDSAMASYDQVAAHQKNIVDKQTQEKQQQLNTQRILSFKEKQRKDQLRSQIITIMEQYPLGVHYNTVAREIWQQEGRSTAKDFEKSEAFENFAKEVRGFMAAPRADRQIFNLHSHPGQTPATGRYILRKFITQQSIPDIVAMASENARQTRNRIFDANTLKQRLEQELSPEISPTPTFTSNCSLLSLVSPPQYTSNNDSFSFTGPPLNKRTAFDPSKNSQSNGYHKSQFQSTRAQAPKKLGALQNQSYDYLVDILSAQFNEITKNLRQKDVPSPFTKENIQQIFAVIREGNLTQEDVYAVFKALIDPYYKSYQSTRSLPSPPSAQKVFDTVLHAIVDKQGLHTQNLNVRQMLQTMIA